MKKNYGVLIRIQEIIPSIGNTYKYSASIQVLETGVGKIDCDISEIIGENKEITIKKAKDSVFNWFRLNKKNEDYDISFE